MNDKNLISRLLTTAIDKEHVVTYTEHMTAHNFLECTHYSNYFTQLYQLSTCLCNPYEDGFAFLLPAQPS